MRRRKFGLVGHPIAHSLSPALFKAGYEGRYPYELVETADFEEAYRRFLEGYDGINVTAPFKELAYAKADILSEECKAIGATNLLIKTPEGVKAYNSDYLGVRLWLEEIYYKAIRTQADVSSAGEKREDAQLACKVLIVGTGGAGKAAAAAAESLGMTVIRMNRQKDSTLTHGLEMRLFIGGLLPFYTPCPRQPSGIGDLPGQFPAFPEDDGCARGQNPPRRRYRR